MKTAYFIKRTLLLCSVMMYSLHALAIKNPVDYVNPLIGTDSKYELSTGNTYPTIALPWGMNFWTPQTGKMGDGWTYTYKADKIRGFKQTHQPSPWMNDYGQFTIMPVADKLVFDEDKRASWYSHKAEVVKPYFYKVYLADHDITAEMAPTERAAMFRFTYPETKESYLVLDAFDRGSYVKIIPEENKIIGYSTRNTGGVPENFKNYFVLQFDKPFTFVSTASSGDIHPNKTEESGKHAGAIVGFSTRRGEVVHVKVASSFISYEQAELNLNELAGKSFDDVVANGRNVWNRELAKLEVNDDNIDNIITQSFRVCVHQTNPVNAVNFADFCNQLGQFVFFVNIFAIACAVLCYNDDFSYTFFSQPFCFFDTAFHWAAAVWTTDKWNSTVVTAVGTAFCNFQISIVAWCRDNSFLCDIKVCFWTVAGKFFAFCKIFHLYLHISKK